MKSTSTGYFTVNCSAFEQSYSSNDSLKYKLQFQFGHHWFKMIQDKKDRPDFQFWWILKEDWPWVLLTCFFGGKIMLSDLYWSLWSNFDRPNFVIPAIFKYLNSIAELRLWNNYKNVFFIKNPVLTCEHLSGSSFLFWIIVGNFRFYFYPLRLFSRIYCMISGCTIAIWSRIFEQTWVVEFHILSAHFLV